LFLRWKFWGKIKKEMKLSVVVSLAILFHEGIAGMLSKAPFLFYNPQTTKYSKFTFP